MPIPVRKAVRVLLLNSNNELLLMCVEGFDIATVDGQRNNRFWCTLGGGIEPGETTQHAALREIFEESGLTENDIELGPIVWYGDVTLILKGTPTILAESFIVAKTNNLNVALHKPTQDELEVVKQLKWFSLEDIKNSTEIIFPVLLPHYLPDILAGNYPEAPIKIDLQVSP
jgi:8-oxo-dGTP pyrophosphatase MutT (NUDIX family)